MESKKAYPLWRRKVAPLLVVLARLVAGATFAFSGFVKTVDPAGMSLKIREYLLAFGIDFMMPIAFFLAVCLGVYEMILGVNLLFGSYRRVSSVMLFLTMLVMTPLTLYLALADPISDCGCFGEALYLTHWQSFAKNVVLLLISLFLVWGNRKVKSIYHKEIQSLTLYFVLFFAVGLSLHAYYNQPIFDFRPYKVGTDISRAISSEAFDQTRYLYRNGDREELFTVEENFGNLLAIGCNLAVLVDLYAGQLLQQVLNDSTRLGLV